MTVRRPLFVVPVLLSLLAACSASPATSVEQPPIQPPTQPAAPTENSSPAQEDLARVDEQGMVAVEVIPLNLSNAGETLDFQVAMNTHSVDLSMDLATLASLSTDTGKVVSPVAWDAPRGGHHVRGTLSFPASVDGTPLLDGATRLTLTITDVDAAERVFTWDLSG